MMKRFSLEEASKYRKLYSWESQYIKAIGFTLEPDGNGFDDVTYYGESLKEIVGSKKKPEWIYILANKYLPGILKIGYTTTSITQRVNEINASTGVLYPYFPVFGYKCANAYQLEQEVHKYLEGIGIRINPAREGFEIEIDDAIEVIENLGSRYRIENIPEII